MSYSKYHLKKACVHDTFHVSNLKKCLADLNLHVPLEEIKVDARLNFVEEPVEILEREIKKLKRSRIPIVKCTALVEKPTPANEDSEPLPLKESGIRFTVKNRGTPLYIGYKTFCQSTRLEYNNEENIQPADKGLPATNPDEGIRQSKLLPDRILTDPKDPKINTQLAGRGFASIDTDKSMANIKYQVDKTSPLNLRHFQLLLEDSDDELKELSDDDVFEAEEEMDDAFPIHTDEESQPPPYTENPSNESQHVEPTSIEHQSPTPKESTT
ncbi:hypothetical protein Tco_0704572 [Tanacetum coccineum]|uniref:Reverse transcriptase domain-containing protein n=1 Tax=Tanacetum coccineum TaxID=301880 RepID=A0ABQ4Y3J0_9ASTR